MVTNSKSAPNRRERRSFAQRIAAFWRHIEPGVQIDRNNTIENWAATAEGRATCIDFEGFGITFLFFVGRTPTPVQS